MHEDIYWIDAMEITQVEADALLAMEKVCSDASPRSFPDLGGSLQIDLLSRDERELFILDISRRRISLSTKYQTRARQSVVLARLDFNSPHRNPDGNLVGVPHLHLYRDGYGDKWAFTIPDGMLTKPNDARQTLIDFMNYCKIVEQPHINWGLFS